MANMNPYRGRQGHREVGNSHALLVGIHTGTGILETNLTELSIVCRSFWMPFLDI